MRECKVCGSLKDESEFREYKDKRHPGAKYRAWMCRSCMNKDTYSKFKNKIATDPEYRMLIAERKRNDNYRPGRRDKINTKYRNLKQQMVDYKGGKCMKCGYNKCIGSLQFHHIDPSQKSFQVSLASTFEKAKPELNKTIMLCSNCHDELHFIEGKQITDSSREKMSLAHLSRKHSEEEKAKRTASVLKHFAHKRKLELVTI
jgi:hypothetical protein